MQSSTFGVYHFWLLLVRVQLRFVFSFFLHFLVDFHISIIKLQVMVNMKDVKNASDVGNGVAHLWAPNGPPS